MMDFLSRKRPSGGERAPDAAAPADVRRLLEAQMAAAEQVLQYGRELNDRLRPRSGADAALWLAHPPPSTNTREVRTDLREVSATPGTAGDRQHGYAPLLLQESTGETEMPMVPVKSYNKLRSKTGFLLFPNTDGLKEMVKNTLAKNDATIEQAYHEHGVFQAIATDYRFKQAGVWLICLNAIWLGIDTDWNPASSIYAAPPVFKAVENLFCAFFTFELVVRFMAHRSKCAPLKDAWFLFDASLVAMMVWETWIHTLLIACGLLSAEAEDLKGAGMARLLRLLRLTRVLRMGRLLKEVPELLFIVKSLSIAARSVLSTLVLLLAFIYVFSIVLVQLLKGTPAERGCFGNIPQAINCLFLEVALPDQKDIADLALEQSVLAFMFTMLFLFVGALTLMNMLIATLCEVVSVVSKEQAAVTKIEACRETLHSVLSDEQSVFDQRVTQEHFLTLMANPDMVTTLAELDVDVPALVEYADVVFEDQESFDVDQLVESVMQLRTSNVATVKDLVHVRRVIGRQLRALRRSVSQPAGSSPSP